MAGSIAILTALILDQVSKWVILLEVMDPPRRIAVLPFMDLVLTWNPGISFGLFGDGSLSAWVFIALSAVISAGLVVWMLRSDSVWLAIALGLIVGGAIGNIVDRLVHGAVVDFVLLYAGSWSWPVFNVADMAITAGVAMVLLDSFVFRKSSRDGPA